MNEFVNSEISALVGTLLVEESSGERWFDFGRGPAVTERLGASIANRTRAYNPDVVASWFGPDEAVLAHIVARELDAVRTAIELDLGLLSLESELPPASKILLVSTSWNSRRPLAPLRTLLEGQGHTIVAAASLVRSSAEDSQVDDLPLITLTD